MQFIKTFIDKSAMKEPLEHLPTVEKLQEFFEHCSSRRSKSFADYSFTFKNGIGSLISWHINQSDSTGLGKVTENNMSSYIKWSNHPEYAFLSIEEGKVCYYYNSDCNSEIYNCELTNDMHHIKMINHLFNHYYKKFVVEPKLTINVINS